MFKFNVIFRYFRWIVEIVDDFIKFWIDGSN